MTKRELRSCMQAFLAVAALYVLHALHDVDTNTVDEPHRYSDGPRNLLYYQVISHGAPYRTRLRAAPHRRAASAR